MKILITGATGFIGSHLVERLIRDRYNVIILKRSTSDIWRIKNVLNKLKSYDIDKIDVETIIGNEKIDFIIHMATNYGRKSETIKDIIESNIVFPSVLIETALKNGLRGFINTDTSTLNTYSFYSSTKKAFLHLLNYFHKEKELKIINLQLQYVYGPKDDESKFIPHLIKSILKDESIDASPGMQKRDFIFVEDVIDGFLGAIDLIGKMDKDFFTLEIGMGRAISIRDFSNIVERLTNRRARINWGSLPYRKSEIFDLKADIKITKELLNWRPKHSLDEGLKKTIKWFNK
jgi:nucleoside-diphosphate-sugar epimerase